MIRFILFILAAWPVLAVTNSVTVYDTSGSTQTDRVIILPRFFKSGEIANYAQPVVDGTPATAWQCDLKNQWSDSSLRWAIISFKATISASSSITVTFQNNTNPCSSGNQAACDAASLDATGMLAFASSAWGGKIEATQNSTTYTTDSRTLLTNGDFTYDLRGPVVTRVIAEDATSSRTYDFGWTCATNCADTIPDTDYSTATWTNDTTNKSLHPRFILTFPNGFGGVRVQPMIENIWSELLQDQRYAISIKDKNNNVEATVAEFAQWARTRRSMGLEFWDLATPGTIRMDLNLPYMVDSRILPNYDTSVTVNATALTNEKTSSDADNCIWGDGCGYDYNATAGDTINFASMEEAGMFQRWDALYFYSFDDNLKTVVERNCNMSEGIQMHFRDSATGKYFVDLNEDGSAVDDAISSFGRIVSVDSRADFTLREGDVFTIGTEKLIPLATLSTGYLWAPDAAHQPSFCTAAYLESGNPYWLEEIQYWAAFNIATATPGTCEFCRHDDWGFLNDSAHQIRGQGWSARTIGQAALLSSGYENTYFEQKLKYHAAVLEGFLDIQDGNFYNDPTHGAKWTWGRNTVAWAEPNTLALPARPNRNSALASYSDLTKVCDDNSQFMFHMKITAEGWLRDAGYTWYAPILEREARLLIEQTLNTTSSSVYLGTAYHLPITINDGTCSNAETYFSTVAGMYDGLSAALTADLESNFTTKGSYQAVESGFDHQSKAATAVIYPYSYNGLNGSDVWAWYSGNVPNQSSYADNPKWALLPLITAAVKRSLSGQTSLSGGVIVQ